MSNDDKWLENLKCKDLGPMPAVLGPSGGAFCDYTGLAMKGCVVSTSTVQVTFDYEAWFTGAIDSASLALGVKNVDVKLLNVLASSSKLCDTKSCIQNSISCVDNYNKAKDTALDFLGVTKNSTDVIQSKCKFIYRIDQLIG